MHAILIGMLFSSLLVLASFCLVHALQMLATRADLQLHVAFILMLPSSLLVLASFYPVHSLQMLANYVLVMINLLASYTRLEKSACKQHLFRANCSRATSNEYFVHELKSLRANILFMS